MNSGFLEAAGCCFGGGTCLALRLGEFRESVDIDFLCASQPGYRALRSTVTNVSLGEIFSDPPTMLREVRFDRYGIRTVFSVDDIPIKFEIVLEGRVGLDCERIASLPVPILDRVSLFTEKLLANSDRYADRSVYGRDLIDLLVMIEHWGEIPRSAWERANQAYGGAVATDFQRAMQRLANDPGYLDECFTILTVNPAMQASIRGRLALIS
jgi:hypothetical protein